MPPAGTIPDQDAARPVDMSVVVATGGGATAVRMVVASLAAQSVADRIELLLRVSPGTDTGPLHPLFDRFAAVRVLDDAPVDVVDRACGRAALLAEADLVAVVEDHAFPDPEWAERMIGAAAAHDVVAINSGILNANPHTVLSWANFLLAYAQWSDRVPEGPAEWVAHHNATFRTAALRRLAESLTDEEYAHLFNREGSVIRRLKDADGTFLFLPSARIRHVNPASWASTFALRRRVGRFYAANRARDEGWGPAKRLAYAGLSPAIPVLRFLRERGPLTQKVPGLSPPKFSLALMTGLVIDALGQAQGYLAGPGRARAELEVFEMDRAQHLQPADRARFYTTA